MKSDEIVGLLAEPARLRVFSAVVLGASSAAQAAASAGTSAKETNAALRRLRRGGLIAETDGVLRPRTDHLREIVRETRPARPEESHGYADQRVESLLRTFVRDGRLVSMPSHFRRRRVVLQHLVERTFEVGRTYDERTVNEKLKVWCEGAETDHVTVRRYLIDLCLLGRRDGGDYWRRTDVQPAL
ncbi:DUF2087 domain-containing protein [Streptomyces odontomachi]|uniref:DUF2087 domain-containing protein n=1 Tax=Streptomyces odontomachi TaxID=2944940 RepID=UPI002109C54C|nr:DUF2087 domain-containing protein [Streptomyces sp. ODS25]